MLITFAKNFNPDKALSGPKLFDIMMPDGLSETFFFSEWLYYISQQLFSYKIHVCYAFPVILYH